MNAPWWLAKVSAAWKRKHGPPCGCSEPFAGGVRLCAYHAGQRREKTAQWRKEAFGEVTAERDAELRQKLVDAHAGKGPLL